MHLSHGRSRVQVLAFHLYRYWVLNRAIHIDFDFLGFFHRCSSERFSRTNFSAVQTWIEQNIDTYNNTYTYNIDICNRYNTGIGVMVSAQILQVRVEYRYLIPITGMVSVLHSKWESFASTGSQLNDFPPMLNSSVVPKTSIGIEVVSKCIKFWFWVTPPCKLSLDKANV